MRRGEPLSRRLAPRLLLDLAILALAFTLALPGRAGATLYAQRDPAQTCLDVADRAADRHGVPRAVMRALTRTETGRALGGALQPWAWTVNMEGAGKWFDSRAEALAYVRAEQARGARSFDVGCFQLNHRWHGENFASVEEMFEPAANADYAARFIRELYDESGDWARAAGFYHSRTPEFFNKYRERFARILSRGDDETGPVRLAALGDGGTPPRDRRERFAPDDPDRRAADRPRRSEPLLWRAAEAPPANPGGVQIRLLRGGLGALPRASGPLIGP